jgi:demethylmenaquinone methyltransferase/2-methoxy-6-polyprenyl-1,4-benzoquinol methylase
MNDSEKIKKMFSKISKDYDFLNHFLSLGIDNLWRKKVSLIIRDKGFEKVLDVACGTGDLTEEISKKIGKPVLGVDFCFEMVEIAKKKYENQIFVTGDATKLPFKHDNFDALTIAFGIRNIPLRITALKEFYNVIKKEGYLIILEFSMPENFFMKFYFSKILPFIGGLFSNKEAYEYLPNSVKNFPDTICFKKEIESVGFKIIEIKSLNFGLVKIYIATK